MVRIDFESGLIEREHEELIKEVEQYRMAEEGMKKRAARDRSSSRLLALLGKHLASLGKDLEQRYGTNTSIKKLEP